MIVWLLLVKLIFTYDGTTHELPIITTYDTHGACASAGQQIEQFLEQDGLTIQWKCVESPIEHLN